MHLWLEHHAVPDAVLLDPRTFLSLVLGLEVQSLQKVDRKTNFWLRRCLDHGVQPDTS